MNLRYSPFDCVGANAFIFCLPRHHSMFSMVTRGSLPREKESFPGLLVASRVSVHRSNKRDFLFFFSSFLSDNTQQSGSDVSKPKTRQRTWSDERRCEICYFPTDDFSMTCAQSQCNNLFLKREESDFSTATRVLTVSFFSSSSLL